MGRSTKLLSILVRSGQLLPLREHWRQANQTQMLAQLQRRCRRRTIDQNRPVCTCQAYPWPHRPLGGFCRHPNPPIACQLPALRDKPRRYGQRHIGLRRTLARALGLHPIRDRQVIDEMLPMVLEVAKRMKQQHPRFKYRNLRLDPQGLVGLIQSVGPHM